MSINANYVATPKNFFGALVTANAGRDGTGTVVTIATAAATGTRIDDISIKAIGTTTVGMIRLFLYSGTTYYLYDEIQVSAVTPSATTKSWSTKLTDLALILQTGWSLRASTEKTETFHITTTRSGDF